MSPEPAQKPPRLGNAPRQGGYVAWHDQERLGRFNRGARARVVRCDPLQLWVSVQGCAPLHVPYHRVYPCEPPG